MYTKLSPAARSPRTRSCTMRDPRRLGAFGPTRVHTSGPRFVSEMSASGGELSRPPMDTHAKSCPHPCLYKDRLKCRQWAFEAVPDGVALGRVATRIVDRWNAHGHHPVAYQVETFDMSVFSSPVGQLAAGALPGWWPPAGLHPDPTEGRGARERADGDAES